ncbi:LutC/YkgG family protein [Belliella aquatica]|nr:LUD domain-containing protein [Belliella aquatica]MCH7404338.1 LUD domain-containing protein [Belliella aquatica]
MNSREHILSEIRKLKLPKSELFGIPIFGIEGDLLDSFKQAILSNKGEVISEDELIDSLQSGGYINIYTPLDQYATYSNCDLPEDPHDFRNLDLAVVRGHFGVAENGAIWLDDTVLAHRVLPFITEHLIIVLDQKSIVSNMHEAYSRIGQEYSGFGVFIAGPSKTADIEQSLVIGAHGAKSLRVVMLGKEKEKGILT